MKRVYKEKRIFQDDDGTLSIREVWFGPQDTPYSFSAPIKLSSDSLPDLIRLLNACSRLASPLNFEPACEVLSRKDFQAPD
jgi:hypothetical protein